MSDYAQDGIISGFNNSFSLERISIMTVDLLDFLKDLFGCSGLKFTFLAPPYENISEVDMGFRQKMSGRGYSEFITLLENTCSGNTICLYRDSLRAGYALFSFPPGVAREKCCQYGILGPFLASPVTSAQLNELMKKGRICMEMYKEFMEYYNAIPVITASSGLSSNLIVIGTYLYGGSERFRLIDLPDAEVTLTGYSPLHQCQDPPAAMALIEERYRLEDEMLSAVRFGDFNRASLAHEQFSKHRIMPRSADALRNQKNLMFVLNTLLRKTVQDSSVHPLHIDDISSRFAIRIETCTSLDQLDQLGHEMIRKYCSLVKNHSLQGYSPLIQKVLSYIEFNYAEPLSLSTLSDHFSVSPSYLSASFRKELDVTLTDYINSKRIQNSLVLLNTTSLPIRDIAAEVGFSDMNYYTRLFKKRHGMSPRDYRDSLNKVNL